LAVLQAVTARVQINESLRNGTIKNPHAELMMAIMRGWDEALCPSGLGMDLGMDLWMDLGKAHSQYLFQALWWSSAGDGSERRGAGLD